MSVQELVVPLRPRLVGGRLFWTLGLGAFGLAFSITTLTFLPVELGHFTSSGTLIALVLGAEGLFALLLSPVIGPWSDTFHTPLGRRRPFMLVAIGPMAFCLVLMPFMPNLWTTALVVFAFFFAYYVYEPPYRGLYPDLLPSDVFGKAQGVQHVLRGFRAYLSTSWCIVREEADVRSFLVANAAWEGTFAAARIFVVLYVTRGLHESPRLASLVLATVAGGYVVAAVWSGRVADRIGLGRVIFFCSFVYGGGLLAGGWAREWHDWYYGLVFPVAIAGGAVMTQAWGLLFKLMPPKHRGAISGLATTTKGIGLIVGPLLAGGAIDLASPYLRSTDGYQVLWPACAVPILAVIPLVGRLMRREAALSGS